ncbi:MAG: tetratricopeptide repeat protein [Chloroflexi bacterium]|nr:tetratricopeptide repeat protein [Chloroflexota bacterium]
MPTSPPPPPKIRGSAAPEQRLKQAKQHLQKGRGFEAFVLLNDFPESEQAEPAAALLPLARFLFDMDDGDGLTGVEALDTAYKGAAQALKRRKPAQALDQLFAVLNAGEAMDRAYATRLIQSVLALLGEDNPLTAKYRPILPNDF